MISGRHDHKDCNDEGAQKLEQGRHTLNWSNLFLIRLDRTIDLSV
jgi:hypothetical protein